MYLEVLAIGHSPAPYVRMLRKNGLYRTIKTVARKSLGSIANIAVSCPGF